MTLPTIANDDANIEQEVDLLTTAPKEMQVGRKEEYDKKPTLSSTVLKINRKVIPTFMISSQRHPIVVTAQWSMTLKL